MKLKDKNIEELQLLSYTDLTDMILKEAKKTLNTPKIFHQICDILGYSDTDYTNKIGDYYTSLTLDRRFVLLDNAEWDLRDNHSLKLTPDDDEEELLDDIEEVEEEKPVAEEEVVDNMDTILEEEDLEDVDDDMEDLTIVSEEEVE